MTLPAFAKRLCFRRLSQLLAVERRELEARTKPLSKNGGTRYPWMRPLNEITMRRVRPES